MLISALAARVTEVEKLQAKVTALEAKVQALEQAPAPGAKVQTRSNTASGFGTVTAKCEAGEAAINCENVSGGTSKTAVVSGNQCTCTASNTRGGIFNIQVGQCKLTCLSVA